MITEKSDVRAYAATVQKSAEALQHHSVLFTASDTLVSYICIQSELALYRLDLYATNPACVQYSVTPLLFSDIEHLIQYAAVSQHTFSDIELELLRKFSPRIILVTYIGSIKVSIRITHLRILQDIIKTLQTPVHIVELKLVKLQQDELKSMLDIPSVDHSYTNVQIDTYSNFPACIVDLTSHSVAHLNSSDEHNLLNFLRTHSNQTFTIY